MKNRHTPIKECDFIKMIEPHKSDKIKPEAIKKNHR